MQVNVIYDKDLLQTSVSWYEWQVFGMKGLPVTFQKLIKITGILSGNRNMRIGTFEF